MAVNGTRPVVVVGTDGSRGSVKALRWARRQANATGAEVRVGLAGEVRSTFGYVAHVDHLDWAGVAATAAPESAAAGH